jgi:hypothetical protein
MNGYDEDHRRDDLARQRRDRGLARLIDQQCGIVARRQLTAFGVDWDAVQANELARRWVVRTPRVVSTVTGALTVEQRRWVGVLHAGPRSMLGGLTAGSHHGLSGWETDIVTVLVDDELSFDPVDGVRFFRSRRPFHLMASPRSGIASARVEPALLLWAGYQAQQRAAVAGLAAAVQQRLTTAERLYDWVDVLRPLRRAKVFKRALSEIAGGAHSGPELDLARLCRDIGLPRPDRQRSRNDRHGRRRWTDCEWDLPDGTVLVLEIDGSHHMEVRSWHDDLKRSRALTTRDRIVVRCSAYELRHEPASVAVDLIALGLSGRMPDSAA